MSNTKSLVSFLGNEYERNFDDQSNQADVGLYFHLCCHAINLRCLCAFTIIVVGEGGGGINQERKNTSSNVRQRFFLAQMSAIPLKRLSKILKYECYGKEGVEKIN